MTKTQDLSLLTDEEIRREVEAIVEQIDAAPVESRIRALANALIAARAENKRKDEVIAGVRAVVQEVAERPTVSESPGVHAYEFTDLEDALTVRARALLHSEKGE